MRNEMVVFYDERQNVRSNESFSPSAQKPAQVAKSWRDLGLATSFVSFKPSTRDDIKLVHDPAYVDGVLDCREYNGFGNKSPEVAAALPWVCGSMAAAALYAYEHKVNTFSPTSGAHHAHYARGLGYCTFNFLMMAALIAHNNGAKKIGIVDCDMHHGDGTENIIMQLEIDYIRHYSFAKSSSWDWDSSEHFIDEFAESLREFDDCDLILYNAGVDPHVNDPLGGVLTTEQMASRDFILYLCMKSMHIPVATSLAGGYQRDKNGSISAVIELHNNTLRECHRVLSEY